MQLATRSTSLMVFEASILVHTLFPSLCPYLVDSHLRATPHHQPESPSGVASRLTPKRTSSRVRRREFGPSLQPRVLFTMANKD